jgi:hypothetical protein
MNSSNRTLTAIKDIEGGIFRKNYISNDGANFGTTGWNTYADAAGTRPVDGSGGSPSSTLTRSTTSPLSNDASFLWAKSANNRQGEGFSYDFTIDDADKQKLMTIEFDYQIASGTFVGSQDIATNSDLIVYLYDITASVLVEPSPFLLDGTSSSSYFYRYRGSFQTTSSSQYRLIVHTATTSANGYTVKFDNFKVSAGEYVNGAIATDWVINTDINVSGAGTVTEKNIWTKRVGDSLHIRGTFKTGTVSGTDASLDLPGSLPIDLSKINSYATRQPTGIWYLMGGSNAITDSGNSQRCPLFSDGSTNNALYFTRTYTSDVLGKQGGSSIWGSSQNVGFHDIVIPIQGWSSGMNLASDGDNRLVAAKYFYASTAGSVSSTLPFQFNTKSIDTHNSVTTGSSWKFTAPVYGIYEISTCLATGGGVVDIYIYKNGTQNTALSGTATGDGGMYISGTSLVELNAGDYIDIRPSGATTQGGGTTTFVSVHRVMGNLMATMNAIGKTTVYDLVIGATTTAPTIGSSPAINLATWKRVGDCMEIQYTLVNTNAGTSGTGTYLFPIPTGYTIDSAKIGFDTSLATGNVGSASFTNAGNVGYAGWVKVYDSTNLAIVGTNDATAAEFLGSTLSGVNSAGVKYSFKATVPIVGW